METTTWKVADIDLTRVAEKNLSEIAKIEKKNITSWLKYNVSFGNKLVYEFQFSSQK